MVQAGLGKRQEPISKIPRAKMAEGMDQVVECLSGKYETLSSNFILPKTKAKCI
jgi:hypothetical protein